MTEKKTNNLQNINYRLSVQVSLTGLSFLVADLEMKVTHFFSEKTFPTPLSPEELLFEIDSSISNNDVLRASFSEVVVVYSTKMYTTVPLPLFEESRASEYLKFNAKILATDFIAHDIIAHDIIAQDNLVVVYVPFVNINNFFFEKYGSFQYYHGATALLKRIFKIEKYAIVPKMYLQVQHEQVDCVIVDDGLRLCNTYSFKTPEDFIYYILFSLEQLKLSPESITVFLSGNIEKGDDNYQLLYTYIRTIKFVENIMSLTSDGSHKDFLINNSLL